MKQSPRRARRQSVPTRRKTTRTKGVVSAARGSTADDATRKAASSQPISALELSDSESPASGALIVFGGMIGMGLLLLGAAAVSPARVPWPVVSEPLYLYRSNLAAIGLGTVALGLLLINAAVLL